MPAGKLQVTAVTLRGLAENGLAESMTFLGCFVSPSEKHRTRSAAGPEPQWNQTLHCTVPEGESALHVEVVNEDPGRPGILGGGSVDLAPVFAQGRAEQWVAINTPHGQPLGHAYLNLTFAREGGAESPVYAGAGAPPPVYNGPPGYPQEKQAPPHYPERGQSYSSLGPEQPLPPNYGSGTPPPFSPPAPVAYGQPQSPIGSTGSPYTPNPEQSPEKQKKKVPEWMKYGGAALAGAAAVGLGTWVAHEVKEHNEEEAEREAQEEAAREHEAQLRREAAVKRQADQQIKEAEERAREAEERAREAEQHAREVEEEEEAPPVYHRSREIAREEEEEEEEESSPYSGIDDSRWR
ncbi:hypothetical protein DFQ28_010930 [Apophysomyces sp. BC1034]|nr:hypothetical protein DFQ30_010635 [Apophysomyces sp. BC1015]KAG0170122.1 hypothetical protein DFQ29_009424 [Apophysomyces sp. BC1021]KAG0184561.1 hypothetical protein DFQ28_010930 [Apophysomyces sp. BC1034]